MKLKKTLVATYSAPRQTLTISGENSLKKRSFVELPVPDAGEFLTMIMTALHKDQEQSVTRHAIGAHRFDVYIRTDPDGEAYASFTFYFGAAETTFAIPLKTRDLDKLQAMGRAMDQILALLPPPDEIAAH